MRTLTLDTGAIFGYAYGNPFGNRGPPFSGTFSLPDLPVTRKMIALENFLINLIKANEITDVYVEQNFIPERTSFQAVTLLAGYVLVAGMAASRCNCKCSTVELSTWRSELGLPTRGPKNVLAHPDYARFATTRDGKPKKGGQKEAQRQWVKDRAKEYAIKRGSAPKDDNESDAICMWWWKTDRLQRRLEETKNRKDLFDEIKV